MSAMLNLAIRAAREAGDLINRATLDLEKVRYAAKGPGDFVTEIDHAAEQKITKLLQEAYPSHGILAEESGVVVNPDARYQWIIDPLDGTTNFIHGLPHFAVSIALQVDGVSDLGVIYAPALNQLYTTRRGSGAFLDNRRIRVSKRTSVGEALLSTSFPIKTAAHSKAFGELFVNLTQQTAGVRRMGSAVLDLANVASGAFDVYYGVGLKPWDMAAGALMVVEAGGLLTDADGKNAYMQTGSVIAGNPKLYAALMPSISPVISPLSLVQ